MSELAGKKETYVILRTKPYDGLDITVCFGHTSKDQEIVIYQINGRDQKEKKVRYRSFVQLMKTIMRSNLRIPRFIEFNKKDFFLVQKTLNVPNVLTLLSQGPLDEEIYSQVFRFEQFAKVMHLNLDYRPQNFVFQNKKLFYIGQTFKQYEEKETLSRKDIRLWVYSPELVTLLKDHQLPFDQGRLKNPNELNKEIVLLVYKFYQI